MRAMIIAAAFVGLCSVSAAQTWTALEPTDDLEDAIENAQDGDVLILVGNDPHVGDIELDGKALSILAQDGNVASVTGRVLIENLGAGQQVLLRNLQISPAATGGAGKNRLRDNVGVVWIEGCTLKGSSGFTSQQGQPGLKVEDSDAVVLVRSTIHGGLGDINGGTSGGPMPTTSTGLVVVESTVDMYDCEVTGHSWAGRHGGHGITISDPNEEHAVVALNCTILGGDGGQGFYNDINDICYDGGNGGDGVRDVASSIGTLVHFDSTVTGGAGGAAPTGCSGSSGAMGDDISVNWDTDLNATLDYRDVAAQAISGGGDTMLIDVTGLPGEAFVIAFSNTAIAGGPLWPASVEHLAAYNMLLPICETGCSSGPYVEIIPSGGHIQLEIDVDPLAQSGLADQIFLQPLYATGEGNHLGTPTGAILFQP